MAARRKRKKDRKKLFDDLAPQTKQAIWAVFFAVFGIFLVLSLVGAASRVGDWTEWILTALFGKGAYLAPLACGFYVYALLNPREDDRVSISKVVGIGLIFLSLLGLLELSATDFGGLIGKALAVPLTLLVETLATAIILVALMIVGVFLTFNTNRLFPRLFNKQEPVEEEDLADIEALDLPEEDEEAESDGADAGDDADEAGDEPEEEPKKRSVRERMGFGKSSEFSVSSFQGTYDPPPLSLLQKDRGKARVGDAKANANIIKRTLKNFNIDVEMDEVSIGPSVTRYALKPAEGVRIARIAGLQKDLELSLAASPIRIEAPIPGKALVGVEVPNTDKTTIGLASLLTSPEYTDSPKPLLVALGKDITGHAHFADISKMPHALIAGTTGSGKSVTIHSLITSLLFRNSPDQLRFIMIDPKRVELTLYNGIPHLLTPVITDAKKSLMSLKWAIKEMERRYDILQAEKVRDIGAYHDDVFNPAKEEFEENGSPEDEKDQLPEPLPYIVIIIDELSDLMQAYPRELESLIVRLAQMSRAVGIHLVLATQRPEVKVITGLIKANVPCRIALKVNSQIDSRTILDAVGAEKLLGYGDMLFTSTDRTKPLRLQAAFATTDELKKVVKYLKNQTDEQELSDIDLEADSKNNSDALFASMVDDDDEDELYSEAKETVITAGKASTSYLQRKLGIGYGRAARLMDMLEERGIIGQQNGSKPRDILVGPDEDDTSREE